MKKVMLIGFGAMAQAVIERLPAGVAIGWIVARASHHPAIHDQFGDAVEALTSPMACAQTPDLVLECASQQAVAQYGEEILRRGWHLAIISTGALADSALEQRLLAAGGKLTLLSGAVAGIDGLAAATVALGGVGMDDTRVQLMVDPATKRNTHTLHVEGLFGEFHLELSGLPLASNPKTSTLAALSAVRACRELALS